MARIGLGIGVGRGGSRSWTPLKPLPSGKTPDYYFDFTDLSTMVDDGGGLISKVTDLITGIEATAAGTARPTYVADQINGKGVLRFNGTANTMSHAEFATGGNFTMYVVNKQKKAGGILIARGTDDYLGGVSPFHVTLNVVNPNTWGAAFFNRYFESYNYWSLVKSGTTWNYYERKNERPRHSVTAGNANSQLRITNIGRPTNFFYNSDALEILIYKSTLSAADRLVIDNYYEKKYTLPSETPNTLNRISFIGNSLTSSPLGGQSGTYTYPPTLINNVITSKGPCEFFEFAYGGATTANLVTTGQRFVTDLRTRIPRSKNDIVIVWEGTNDLVTNQNAADAYTRLATMCTELKATGLRVGVATILPRSNAGLYANFESHRQSVNADIRTNFATIADFLIDVGDDALMGQNGDSNNTTYYLDKIHCTPTGFARLVNEWFYPAVIATWVD